MGQTNDRLNFRTWYNISKADRCDMAWKKCVYIKDDHHLTSQFYYIYNWIRLTSKFKEWVVKTLICRLMISYELSKMIQEKRHVYLKSEWNFGIAFIFMIWFFIINCEGFPFWVSSALQIKVQIFKEWLRSHNKNTLTVYVVHTSTFLLTQIYISLTMQHYNIWLNSHLIFKYHDFAILVPLFFYLIAHVFPHSNSIVLFQHYLLASSSSSLPLKCEIFKI
jgi:hypothetical protein